MDFSLDRLRQSRLLKELGGILLLVFALVSLLALLTYSGTDATWFERRPATESPGVDNWIGIVGAHLAELFLQLFGLTAFLVPP